MGGRRDEQESNVPRVSVSDSRSSSACLISSAIDESIVKVLRSHKRILACHEDKLQLVSLCPCSCELL